MEILQLGNYRLSFIAIDDVPIRKFSGSAWRGLFGHSLKKTLCITQGEECNRCLLYHSCGYSYLFETPPPPDTEKMRKYPAVPHPFILQPLHNEEMHFKPGEYFSVGLRLFGKATDYLPYVIQSWKNAGSSGLGQGLHRFQLAAVEQEKQLGSGKWQPIYQPNRPLTPIPASFPSLPSLPNTLELHLTSPLRVNENGRVVDAENLTFSSFFRTLLRRISMLSYFHSDRPLEVDFKHLNQQSREIELIKPKLHWQKWSRYSSRQKSTIDMSGIQGSFSLENKQLEPFWSYLWLGQWLGVGKGAVMGQGQYLINPASLPDRQKAPLTNNNERVAQVAGNKQPGMLGKTGATQAT